MTSALCGLCRLCGFCRFEFPGAHQNSRIKLAISVEKFLKDREFRRRCHRRFNNVESAIASSPSGTRSTTRVLMGERRSEDQIFRDVEATLPLRHKVCYIPAVITGSPGVFFSPAAFTNVNHSALFGAGRRASMMAKNSS